MPRFPHTTILFSAFRGAPCWALAILSAWLVLSRIAVLESGLAGETSAAELQQIWVSETENDTKIQKFLEQPFSSDADKKTSKLVVATLPASEVSDTDTNTLSFQEQFLIQVPDQIELEEYYLAQRGLLDRLDSSRRTGRNQMETGRNVRTAYYKWFDSNRNRSIPIKIYYPINVSESCPTILFSHGLGGSYENCAYLGEYWAYNGYIAVFIHHFGSDDSVWKGKVLPLNELRNAYESHWTGRSRVQDIQFVLSQLERLDEQQDNLPLHLIDKKRIGIAGYDLGALAALVMVGQIAPDGYTPVENLQIKAVLAMSPPVVNSKPSSTIYGKIETPCLFITGTKDDGIVGTTKAAQRRIPFDSITCNDQYLVVFDGTDHLLYAGHLLPLVPLVRNDGQYQHAIARLSANFWNAYLKESPQALEFMMSRNVTGLLTGLGRIERKFYLREHRDISSETYDSDTQDPTQAWKTQMETNKTREVPQYLSVPQSPYSETEQRPRPLRNTGSSTPRRLQVRLP